MGFPKSQFLFGLAAGGCLLMGGLLAYRKLNAKWNPQTYDLPDDILVHGNIELKEVALTFDDGPKPENVRPILDLLGKEGIKATFFVVGKKVEEYPALVRRMIDEGHEVANHSYSHPRLDGMSAEQIREEIAKCGHAVERAAGVGMNLFRPPGMRYDDVVIRTAQDLGYVTVHWNSAAQDFQPQDPARITEKILKRTSPGSVILLHAHPDTVRALPDILAALKSKGYRFLRVSQMLARLPRPVYVRTNAYAADSIGLPRPTSPETSGKTEPKHLAKRPPKPKDDLGLKPDPKGRPGVDVPSWN